MNKRFLELENQGVTYDHSNDEDDESFDNGDDDDDDEGDDNGFSYSQNVLTATTNTAESDRPSMKQHESDSWRRNLLEEWKRNLSSTTDQLITSWNRLQNEVRHISKSVTVDDIENHRDDTIDNSTTAIGSMNIEQHQQSEEQSATAVRNDDIERDNGNNKSLELENMKREESKRKRLEIERRIEEKRRLMQEKEEAFERQRQLMEQKRIEEEQRIEELRLERERQLIEHERKQQESRRQKLEQERKRIQDERRRKEEEEQRRKEEQMRIEQEEREKQERERKEHEQRELARLAMEEEKRRQREEEERKRMEIENELREQNETYERKKRELFQQGLDRLLEYKPSYEYLVNVVVNNGSRSSKHISTKAVTSPQILTEPIESKFDYIRRMHAEWRTRKLKKTNNDNVQANKTNNSQQTVSPITEHVHVSKRITLSEEFIKFHFGYDMDDDMTQIVSMTFSVEKITDIDTKALSKCNSLKQLILDQNDIRIIDNVFQSSAIEYLALNQNLLQSLKGVRHLGSSLVELSANNNKISSLTDVEHLHQLKSLDLSMNSISDITQIQQLHNLESVNFYRNNIISIPDLSRLRNLMSIDLGRNKIASLDYSVLSNCNYLDELTLYENEISEIPHLDNVLLRSISLNGNRIKALPDNFFYLPMLSILNLSSNAIDHLKPLSCCIMLQFLDLSFNNISLMEELLYLEPCNRIMYIRLNDNPVASKRGYKESIMCILPKIASIDNDSINREAKQKARQYFVQHSIDFLSRESEQLFRRMMPGMNSTESSESGESDFMRPVEALCIRQASERKYMENEMKKILAIPIRGNQKRVSMVLELKSKVGRERLEMRKRHYLEHLNFSENNVYNITVHNEEQVRDRASRTITRFFRYCQERRTRALIENVIKIQKTWRGYVTRKNTYPWLLPMLKRRMDAACKIQAVWKGFYVRQLIKKARQLEDEYRFELGGTTENFDDDIRFLDNTSNFDLVGHIPKKGTTVYYMNNNNSGSSSNKSGVVRQASTTPASTSQIKLPSIAMNQNWIDDRDDEQVDDDEEDDVVGDGDFADPVLRSSATSSTTSKARGRTSTMDNSSRDSVTSLASNSSDPSAGCKRTENKSSKSSIAEEWGFENESLMKAFLKSKKRKPKNHKRKNEDAMNRLNRFYRMAHLDSVNPNIVQARNVLDQERLELESIASTSSSSSGGSGGGGSTASTNRRHGSSNNSNSSNYSNSSSTSSSNNGHERRASGTTTTTRVTEVKTQQVKLPHIRGGNVR